MPCCMASSLQLQESQISRPQIAPAPGAGLFDIERSHSRLRNLRLTGCTIPILFCCRMSMTYAVLLSHSQWRALLCVMAHARTIKQKHSGSWTHAGPGEVFQQSRRDRGKCRLSATKRGAGNTGTRAGWQRADRTGALAHESNLQ